MYTLADGNLDFEAKCQPVLWSNRSNNGVLEEAFCDSVWDSVYCWPSTKSGTVTKRTCSEIFNGSYSHFAGYLTGHAYRECLQNGSWAGGNESNYDECAKSFEFYLKGVEEDNLLVPLVHRMLFYGSILSLVCLGISLSIFHRFRNLRCDRVTVHAQLMLSLVLRFALMLVISEPFVFGHEISFRDLDVLCQSILILFLYSTFSSISWMFVEGLFLNIQLMTGVITITSPYQFTFYYLTGWGVPAVFVGVYVISMLLKPQENCWNGYSSMDEIWILLGPITFELVINGIFLLNILRILLRKVRNSTTRQDSSRLKAAVKATAILFPVLGINNLILLYNPGGDYNKYFVILNTFFSATQGIWVAIVFCFADKDVSTAIKRSIGRGNDITRANSSRVRNVLPLALSPLMEMFTRRENNENHGRNVMEETV